jgi:transposase
MAMELSNRQRKLGFRDRRHKIRRVTIEARNLVALQEQIGQAKSRFGLPEDAPVFSCYEAGRDGFWLHHYLVSRGIDNGCGSSETTAGTLAGTLVGEH